MAEKKSKKPPKGWWDKMYNQIKEGNPSYDDEMVRETIGNIWYHDLSPYRKKEIYKEYGEIKGDERGDIIQKIPDYRVYYENEIERTITRLYSFRQKIMVDRARAMTVIQTTTHEAVREYNKGIRDNCADTIEKLDKLTAIYEGKLTGILEAGMRQAHEEYERKARHKEEIEKTQAEKPKGAEIGGAVPIPGMPIEAKVKYQEKSALRPAQPVPEIPFTSGQKIQYGRYERLGSTGGDIMQNGYYDITKLDLYSQEVYWKEFRTENRITLTEALKPEWVRKYNQWLKDKYQMQLPYTP